MKRLLFLLGFSLIYLSMFSQIEEPVKWKFETRQTGEDTHEIIFRATIDPGWHVYSQFVKDGGPVPTSFNFENISGYELVGKAKETSKVHKVYEETFQMDVAYFDTEAVFVQEVKRLTDPAQAKGFLEYMVCNDEKCLPPTAVDFDISLKDTRGGYPGGRPSDDEEEGEDDSEPEPQAATTTPAPPQTTQAEAATTGEAEGESEVESESEVGSDAPQDGIFEPTKWSFSHTQLDDKTYELTITAHMDEGWKVYSQFIDEGGPVPTEFTFKEGNYELVGKTEEVSEVIKTMDEVFEMPLAFFKHDAVFKQKVKFTGDIENVKGELMFMTCNEERCLPPSYVDFVFEIAGKEASSDEARNFLLAEGTNPFVIPTVNLDNPVSSCDPNAGDVVATSSLNPAKKKQSIWGTFVLGFLGGLLALLMPCLFPMIPLTVSFFTKNGSGKGVTNALLYGFSIVLICVSISVPFHLLETADSAIFNEISTSAPLNIFFFLIFVIFGISFLGYFEITLPSSLTNKVSSASTAGGMIGIFFMALTLVLVSFSCTAPIIGSLLAQALSTDGGAWQLTAGMGGFGVALGIPFALFAAFPSVLNKLPQSGGWLNALKVNLGFLELVFALKFLSNADLVMHWGILKREIFFGVWIVIGIAWILYQFGKIKFPHDNATFKLTPTRFVLGATLIAMVAYLIPGLTNTEAANRKLVSGFPPPLFHSIYEKENNCPLGLACFKNYEEGLAYAKKVNKPIMVDFTGWACVNCRRMEENVWERKEIFDRLNDDYVLISLYVDDRKELPKEEQGEVVLSNGHKKRIRTVGNKWHALQQESFATNSQPWYVLLSPDEHLLAPGVGYTPDVAEYRGFLDCGLSAFERLKTENKLTSTE